MRILNFDMRASLIFTLASIYNLKAGSVCATFVNRVKDVFKVIGEEAVKTAIEAVKILEKREN